MKQKEPKKLVDEILDLVNAGYVGDNRESTKILNFGVSKGEIGELL